MALINIREKVSGHFLSLFLLTIFSFYFTVASGEIPPGYYLPAEGKTGESLQIALYNIIKGHTAVSYTPGVWNAFYTTDVKPNGKVWDMYSDVPGGTPPYEYTLGSGQCGVGGGGVEGDCYSREHSFPKSWFNNLTPMYTDLNHIFPTDQYVNNMHSNYPFAKVGTATAVSLNGCKKGSCATPGYTGTVFEPIDEYKGDFARAYFYMATRYENIIASWYANDPYADAVLNGTAYPAFETWYLNLLISWHKLDPVSAKEITRNDAVYQIQHNRNPYIDHPEWVDSVWMPSGVQPEPSNHVTSFASAMGTPSYSALQLTWVDATGTVIPGGYLIRGSTIGFSNIPAPIDGTAIPDGGLDKNIQSSVESCSFSGLLSNTTYYFKIFPYSNAGNKIDFKTDEPVPTASGTTTTGLSFLQPGDIAIVEFGSTDPDKVSFITFKQLNAGTVINFTDNGFTSSSAVRTGEGFLVYTAPTVIPAGTVVSWYSGMNIAGTGWNSATPSGFALATAGDQLFAYQGTWGTNQTLICGLNAGNSGWITSGAASSNTSFLPAELADGVNSLSIPLRNGNYNLITAGSVNALGSLVTNSPNWTVSTSILATPGWTFSLTNSTNISQAATVLDLLIANGESVTVPAGVIFTVLGDITIQLSK
jgi:endonuclease I